MNVHAYLTGSFRSIEGLNKETQHLRKLQLGPVPGRVYIRYCEFQGKVLNSTVKAPGKSTLQYIELYTYSFDFCQLPGLKDPDFQETDSNGMNYSLAFSFKPASLSLSL